MYKGNSQVELRSPRKSKFDLSHERKLTTRMGRLTPILMQEAIPGDKFRGSSEVLLRLAPLLAPIYDQITLYVHYFFVPNRLLWSEWETFITGGRLGPGSTDPVTAPIPPLMYLQDMITSYPTTLANSTLGDYLGVPKLPLAGEVAADYNGITLDVLPFLAYQRCWYDYYRDRNYVADDILAFPYDSGGIPTSAIPKVCTIRTRDWMKEYFTAALPFTQRGVEVLMPLDGSGTVTYLDTSIVKKTDGSVPNADQLLGSGPSPGATSSLFINKTGTGTNGNSGRIENIDDVLLTSSDVSINDLRSAVRLQEWLERNAVAGSRYTESIQAHFDVRPQDSRLQRAEFIGGGRIPVKISEVVNTAFSLNDADETIPAGNMAGHGVTYGNTNRFNYFCPEHGFIVGIMSIMSKPSYYQGLPRMFKRPTFLDYPWPTFAQLGEQRVEKWELYASKTTLLEDADGQTPLFGYQSRYSDWKQAFSSNHGDFRDSLMFWTLVRDFSSAPTLGSTFVGYTDDIQDRIFAASADGSDSFWCYVHNQVSVIRALPYFGTPTL